MEGGTCAHCGTERPWLHRHHITPRSEGGSDDAINILLLCANCHEDIHGGPYGGTMQGRLSHSPEAQAKRGARMRELWADPEYRERQLAKRREAWQGEKGEQRRVEQGERTRQWFAENPDAAAERNAKISVSRTGQSTGTRKPR